MGIEEYIIPIASIIVPVSVLVIVRTLDKGEKRKTQLDIQITEIHTFVETNKTLIARLVENIDKLDERVRRVETDVGKLFGKINGRLQA